MATCCNVTLAGFQIDCEGSNGGITNVWIANFCDVTVTIEDDVVSAISPSSAFHEYGFKRNTGSLTKTLNKDDTTGSMYWSNELVLQFLKMETAKRIEIAALSVGQLSIIVKDANGKYWYLGAYDPVELSDGTGETGTARADFNGYNLTFLEESKFLPFEVPKSVMDEFLNPSTGG